MKSAHKVIAVLFIAGCVMSGCKQDKSPTGPSVPDQPPSPTGSGVLRANIDGSPWTAEGTDGNPSGTSSYSGNILHISGVRAIGVDTAGEHANAETIDLIINLGGSKANLVPGTYELGSMPTQEGEARYRDAQSIVCYTNGSHTGTVTITALDVSSKAVAGTFAFDGIGDNGQTHIVNQGQFDVTWKQQ
jgi:hypothetical protein